MWHRSGFFLGPHPKDMGCAFRNNNVLCHFCLFFVCLFVLLGISCDLCWGLDYIIWLLWAANRVSPVCSPTPWLRPVPAAAATAAAQARSSSAKPTCTSAACLLPPQTSTWSNCVISECTSPVIILFVCVCVGGICRCWKRGSKNELQLYFPCLRAITKEHSFTGIETLIWVRCPAAIVLMFIFSLGFSICTQENASLHDFPIKFRRLPTLWSFFFMVSELHIQ